MLNIENVSKTDFLALGGERGRSVLSESDLGSNMNKKIFRSHEHDGSMGRIGWSDGAVSHDGAVTRVEGSCC